MNNMRYVLFALLVFSHGCGKTLIYDYRVGESAGTALVCRPEGEGPFPIVVYNHGRIVDRVGYREASSRGYYLEGFCQLLAREGFLTFFPIRSIGEFNIPGHAEQVSQAVDYVKTLPRADPSRIALMGFSRGGLLTLMVGVQRQDLKSLVILAPASGGGHFAKAVEQLPALNVPVLLLVEASDEEVILENYTLLKEALETHGKDARMIRYDGGGGHRLFWDVNYYWSDVVTFLRETLDPSKLARSRSTNRISYPAEEPFVPPVKK